MIIKQVRETLKKYKSVRDCDNKLYYAIWHIYYQTVYPDFTRFFMDAHLKLDAVTRESRRARKDHPELNGPMRFERLKKAERAQEAFGKDNDKMIEEIYK